MSGAPFSARARAPACASPPAEGHRVTCRAATASASASGRRAGAGQLRAHRRRRVRSTAPTASLACAAAGPAGFPGCAWWAASSALGAGARTRQRLSCRRGGSQAAAGRRCLGFPHRTGRGPASRQLRLPEPARSRPASRRRRPPADRPGAIARRGRVRRARRSGAGPGRAVRTRRGGAHRLHRLVSAASRPPSSSRGNFHVSFEAAAGATSTHAGAEPSPALLARQGQQPRRRPPSSSAVLRPPWRGDDAHHLYDSDGGGICAASPPPLSPPGRRRRPEAVADLASPVASQECTGTTGHGHGLARCSRGSHCDMSSTGAGAAHRRRLSTEISPCEIDHRIGCAALPRTTAPAPGWRLRRRGSSGGRHPPPSLPPRGCGGTGKKTRDDGYCPQEHPMAVGGASDRRLRGAGIVVERGVRRTKEPDKK
jgi:hypothetical protein